MSKKEHITFRELEFVGKTKKFAIVRIDNQEEIIGNIFWRNGWRRYVFSSDKIFDWDSSCLKIITSFIDKLMEERK